MTSPTIALVGCDPLLGERVRASLSRSPFRLRCCPEPTDTPEADLLVVPADRLAPAVASGPPVIACGPAALMRTAFLSGCVDYLRDPWTPEELVLRAESVLRRQASRFTFAGGAARWEGDSLVTPWGSIPFSHPQAAILRALLRCRGEVLARDTLAAVLGSAARRGSRRVDVHVSAIRRRLRALQPGAGAFIHAVRGKGYVVR